MKTSITAYWYMTRQEMHFICIQYKDICTLIIANIQLNRVANMNLNHLTKCYLFRCSKNYWTRVTQIRDILKANKISWLVNSSRKRRILPKRIIGSAILWRIKRLSKLLLLKSLMKMALFLRKEKENKKKKTTSTKRKERSIIGNLKSSQRIN